MEMNSAQTAIKVYSDITNILSPQRMNPYVFGDGILVAQPRGSV